MATDQLQVFLENIEEAFFLERDESAGGETRHGVIQSYKDGVIAVKGLTGLKMGEVITVQGTNNQALVMNLEKDMAYALVLQSGEGVREGLFVEANGQFLDLGVSDDVIGRVLDPMGEPVDGGAAIKADKRYLHEKIAPGVMTRKSVHQPVQTGILAIDALVPIGRGQRELIIGDRQTGKTAVAIDTILNQKDQDMI